MIAVLGGLGAALLWAIATLCATSSIRAIGPGSVLAWVMLTGLLVVAPWLAYQGVPSGLDRNSAGWLAAAGLGNVLGLFFAYSALRTGKVGIVAPIVSTEGAIAAVIAVIAGEQLADGVGATLGVIALGILLTAVVRDPAAQGARSSPWLVPTYAVSAAFSFGISLYATGRVSVELPIAWTVLPARLAGVLVITIPLAITSRLRLTRRVIPLILTAGVAEVIGLALFATGSRHSIAVSAVLASQVAAMAAVGAFFLLRERLAPIQLVGVGTIIIGIAVLAVLQT